MHHGAEKESRADEQSFDDEQGDEQIFERNDERKGNSDENNYEQTERQKWGLMVENTTGLA